MIEALFGPARAGNRNASIPQHSSQYSLVNTNALDSLQQNLQRMPLQRPNLDHDPLVGNGELRRFRFCPVLQKGYKAKNHKNEADPVAYLAEDADTAYMVERSTARMAQRWMTRGNERGVAQRASRNNKGNNRYAKQKNCFAVYAPMQIRAVDNRLLRHEILINVTHCVLFPQV